MKRFTTFFFYLLFQLSYSHLLASSSHDIPDEKIEALLNQAQKLLPAKPDSSILIANLILELSKQENYKTGQAKAHQLIGSVFYHQGVYHEALIHLQQAEILLKDIGNEPGIAKNHGQLGLLYATIKQPELAHKYQEEALKIYEKMGDKKGLAYAYGNLGRLYEKKQQYVQAINYQEKALNFYTEINDSSGLATIMENIGSIYEDKEMFTIAHSFFMKSLHLSIKNKDSLLMAINLNNIADIHRKTGNYDSAIHYTNQSLHIAISIKDKYQISSAYKDLSKIYSGLKDYQNAYKNLELGRTIYEDMYKSETARQVSLMQSLFQMERKNSEIQKLEHDRKFNYLIKSMLIAGLLIVALIGALIITRQKNRLLNKEKQLKSDKEQFEAQTSRMSNELETINIKQQQLQTELETKAKSLTAHTLHIIGKNKMLEEIREMLTLTIKEDPKVQKKNLKNLIKQIDQSFIQDKDWTDFRTIFEQVHQDFFNKLQQINSDFTPADLRLAALIKLNLPSKDIATTLGISQDSLRIARYRLRKKMNLSEGENLINFILNL